MKKIIVLNGSARAGKDTFADVVRMWAITNISEPDRVNVYNISSVDRVKEAALLLGWDGVKDNKGRKFLSDLKYLSSEVYDGPFNYMKSQIDSVDEGIFCLHIREGAEIKKFVREFPETKTIFIERKEIEVPNNRADQEVALYDYDFYFSNNGSLEDYVKSITKWCKENL